MPALPSAAALSPEPLIASLLEALKSSDPSGRRQAAAAWSALGQAIPAAVALLVEALASGDGANREGVAEALGSLARQAHDVSPVALAALKKASLWDADEAVCRKAMEVLVQLGEKTRPSVAELLAELADANAPLRFSAAQSLAERGEEAASAVGALLQTALRDPDKGVRLQAAMALYKIDRREQMIIPLLINALKDPNEAHRWFAVDCLGAIGPSAKQAVPALLEALGGESKSSLLRKSIAVALEKIEPKSAQGVEPGP
jgi:HEAT repeat protein